MLTLADLQKINQGSMMEQNILEYLIRLSDDGKIHIKYFNKFYRASRMSVYRTCKSLKDRDIIDPDIEILEDDLDLDVDSDIDENNSYPDENSDPEISQVKDIPESQIKNIPASRRKKSGPVNKKEIAAPDTQDQNEDQENQDRNLDSDPKNTQIKDPENTQMQDSDQDLGSETWTSDDTLAWLDSLGA